MTVATRRQVVSGLAATLVGCAAAAPALPSPSWPTPWRTLLAGGPGDGLLEIDPATGTRTPRPALGRATPAGIAVIRTAEGRAVVLISDRDERLRRFVGADPAAGLTAGTLTAARLDPDGTIAWVEDAALATPIRARRPGADIELTPPGPADRPVWAEARWGWAEVAAS